MLYKVEEKEREVERLPRVLVHCVLTGRSRTGFFRAPFEQGPLAAPQDCDVYRPQLETLYTSLKFSGGRPPATQNFGNTIQHYHCWRYECTDSTIQNNKKLYVKPLQWTILCFETGLRLKFLFIMITNLYFKTTDNFYIMYYTFYF